MITVTYVLLTIDFSGNVICLHYARIIALPKFWGTIKRRIF